MAQEFIIKSQQLEDKVNQLLPSQGGAQAGVDLSASSMVVPIIDLTESAEGSLLRQDLQVALSHDSVTTFNVNLATTTIINTTGYFRIFGNANGVSATGTSRSGKFTISDGTTNKDIIQYDFLPTTSDGDNVVIPYDFVIFLEAGDSLSVTATNFVTMIGCTRQIADISGNLVNP